MQIILLILFSIVSFAYDPTSTCHPEEAEKECFNLLCSITPKKLIPTNREELMDEASAEPFMVTSDVKETAVKLASVGQSIKATAKKELLEGGTEPLAHELFGKPVEAFNVLNAIFKEDFKCIEVNGKCQLITSDLSSYSDSLKELYKRWSEATYYYRNAYDFAPAIRKKYLYEILEEMKGQLSPESYIEEKRAISLLASDYDFITYERKDHMKEHEKKIGQELRPFKEHLMEGLKTRINALLERETSSDRILERVKRSCQLASFIKRTLNENARPIAFNETLTKVVASVNEKFLPSLSTSTARALSRSLKPELFHLIDQNVEIKPTSPDLGNHAFEYFPPRTKVDALKDLTLLNLEEDYVCEVKGLLQNDVFDFKSGKIFISKYTVANSYSDAITHEIGHWLSAQIKEKKMSTHSSQKLLKVRACIRGFYPKDREASRYTLNHAGDGLYTEEDFADWFTAKAGLGENGLFCDLKKMLRRKGLDTNSYLPEADETHSNKLFRELNLRMNRGEKLPLSCQNLLNAYPDSQPHQCVIKK